MAVIEPGGPPARQVTEQRAANAGCAGNLTAVDEDPAVREVRKAAVVVDMQMGQYQRFDVARADPETAQLWPDFLLGFDLETYGKPEIGMPAR